MTQSAAERLLQRHHRAIAAGPGSCEHAAAVGRHARAALKAHESGWTFEHELERICVLEALGHFPFGPGPDGRSAKLVIWPPLAA
jgi:hypothetical protein